MCRGCSCQQERTEVELVRVARVGARNAFNSQSPRLVVAIPTITLASQGVK